MHCKIISLSFNSGLSNGFSHWKINKQAYHFQNLKLLPWVIKLSYLLKEILHIREAEIIGNELKVAPE